MGAVLGLLLILGIVGEVTDPAAFDSSSAPSPTPAATAAATATPNVAAIAAAQYARAYNAMDATVNADIKKQNSSTPAISTSGISGEISALEKFDQQLGTIQFPQADVADVHALLSADAALESDLQTLAVNTDSVSNYNVVFPTVTAAEGTVYSDESTLNNDLGLVPTGS